MSDIEQQRVKTRRTLAYGAAGYAFGGALLMAAGAMFAPTWRALRRRFQSSGEPDPGGHVAGLLQGAGHPLKRFAATYEPVGDA